MSQTGPGGQQQLPVQGGPPQFPVQAQLPVQGNVPVPGHLQVPVQGQPTAPAFMVPAGQMPGSSQSHFPGPFQFGVTGQYPVPTAPWMDPSLAVQHAQYAQYNCLQVCHQVQDCNKFLDPQQQYQWPVQQHQLQQKMKCLKLLVISSTRCCMMKIGNQFLSNSHQFLVIQIHQEHARHHMWDQ